MPTDETIREQALDWAVRAGDPAFADWDAFMAWLEADPAHAQAYDGASAAVLDAADTIRTGTPANDVGDGENDVATQPARRVARRPWLGGALAASLVAILALWLMPGGPWSGGGRTLVQTAPGETRSIALGGGTRIDLAGGSALELDRDDPRSARLIDGRALFTVQHDAARPFEVAVGDERLVDIGTVFDVRHEQGALAVAVAEGAVQYDPEGANLRIDPGRVLTRAKDGPATLARIPVEQVGEWREGRLTFDGATLAQVAADLTRATGVPFAAAPASAGATVSGSVLVAPIRERPAALGALLGVAVRESGRQWVIGTR